MVFNSCWTKKILFYQNNLLLHFNRKNSFKSIKTQNGFTQDPPMTLAAPDTQQKFAYLKKRSRYTPGTCLGTCAEITN